MTTVNTDTYLELNRTFSANRARVFDAWTDPKQVQQWYAPGDFYIPEIEYDVRPGGVFELTMANDTTGDRMQLKGEYREVEVPEKLVYTWVWHRTEGVSPETLVTVLFEEIDEGTAVSVRHEFFHDLETKERHLGGWTACLEQLNGLV